MSILKEYIENLENTPNPYVYNFYTIHLDRKQANELLAVIFETGLQFFTFGAIEGLDYSKPSYSAWNPVLEFFSNGLNFYTYNPRKLYTIRVDSFVAEFRTALIDKTYLQEE